MNLIERIEKKLSDKTTRIDPNLFEECATDLLTNTYPNLIPISGGSDHGRDADLADKEQPPIRVAITSSRTYEGARKNLRSSLDSLKRHHIEGTKIVSVSLAELNQSKRVKLEELSKQNGFILTSVVDRTFFAQRLRENGSWRKRLLQLPGGPFSLSRESGNGITTSRPKELVGRQLLIDRLTKLESDAIIWGPPGVGKSSALTETPGLYFVDASPTSERLLDDILSTNPDIIAVDDALRRPEVVGMLLQIRKHEKLPFRVFGVCWPHQVDELATLLPNAIPLQVDLLTRREIATIAKSKGIKRHRDIARILDQARGRAGWAVRLADLMGSEVEWRSVYAGDALRAKLNNTYTGQESINPHFACSLSFRC